MPYSKFSAEDFKDPSKFVTGMDMHPATQRARNQYNKGLEIGNTYHRIDIVINDVWGAGVSIG